MSGDQGVGPFGRPFQNPTSVFLCGRSGVLLDWVTLAFASAAEGGYFWTDVRLPGQAMDPLDPMAKGAIPGDRLSVRTPRELTTDDALANAAITSGLRSDEHLPEVEQLADFLRLPPPTQALIASRTPSAAPPVLVLSNAHRLAPFYSAESVGPLIRALQASGVVVFLVFPDAAPVGRLAFDNIWHLDARDPYAWRSAKLEVERSAASGSVPKAPGLFLREIPFVVRVLERALGS